MNPYLLKTFMLAPDNATGAPEAPLMDAAPVTLDIPEIPKAGNQPAPEIVEIPETKIHGIQGPKEAFGEDSALEMEDMQNRMTGKEPLKRGPDGKFLPKDPTAMPAPKKPTKAAVKAPIAAADPAPVVPPAKFKIGDVEKTPDEWAQHFKDLEAKATKPPEAAKPAEVPVQEPAPAVDDGKADEEFLSNATARYLIPEAEMDEVLSGGKGSTEKFAALLAKVEMNTRKAMTTEFNRVLAMRDNQVQPLLTHHQQIADYQRDQSFLDANPDIKTHPEGYAKYKEVEREILDGYERIQRDISAGKASAVDRAWATIYENQPPEQFAADVAAHTRARLAAVPAPAPVKPAPVRKPETSVPATRPFNGDRPGGAAAHPPTESEDARQLREMTEAGH